MDTNAQSFPVGYHSFHREKVINFQLNRWHSLGLLPFGEVKSAGEEITGYEDWKSVLAGHAERALAENRLMDAAFFFRAAQFFALKEDPDNDRLYLRFVEVFEEAVAGQGFERHDVPYDGAILPAMRLSAGTPSPIGTVVMHGGFDSFIEEFYSMMLWFSHQGYDIIVFDGPGQGNAQRTHGLVFDYQWEKPVRAVLDHFHLEEITLIGLSMGGYLCLRAAAFEPRIRRVIASSVPFDYSQFTNAIGQMLMKLFFTRLTGFTNRQARKRMAKDSFYNWYMSSVMHITGKETPVEALYQILEMNEKNLHSPDIVQDVLLLTGKRDHTVPFKMHGKQIKALTNARSVTGRVFTAEDHADMHCQVGNVGLALQTMHEWIDSCSGQDAIS